MLDQSFIQKIKECTVAVGIMKKGSLVPVTINGSGFVIDPDGYLITATHVLRSCFEMSEKINNEKNIETKPAIFSYSTNEKGTNALHSAIDQKVYIKLQAKSKLIDVDVSIFNLYAKGDNLSCLEISKKKSMNILDSVLMCGYPGGEGSLNIAGNVLDQRLSPLLFTGQISGFIPVDSAPTPQAIQTNIMTTGGSSGSPIIDPDDGKVIAIAQSIISGSITGFVHYNDTHYILSKDGLNENVIQNSAPITGIAQVGPVAGISYHMLTGIDHVVSEMKKGNLDVTFPMRYTEISSYTFHKPHSEDKKK